MISRLAVSCAGVVDPAVEGQNAMVNAMPREISDRLTRTAQARIPLDWPDLPGRSWRLTDILG
jgi:hypothetical protein